MITTAPTRIGTIAASPRCNEAASVIVGVHEPGPLPGPAGPGKGGSVAGPCGRWAEGVGVAEVCVVLGEAVAGVDAAVVRVAVTREVVGAPAVGRTVGVRVAPTVGDALGREVVRVGAGVGRAVVRVGVGVGRSVGGGVGLGGGVTVVVGRLVGQ